jgi:D-alanyl-lipoteichoic acid acyltransferase DltB (MBOAT superfamily)
MLPQFRQDWAVSDEDLKTGVRRISIGILMVVISEVMSGGLYAGAGVDAIFDHQAMGNAAIHLSGIDVWCMIIAYAFQLYFSFCGYSHVVIGVARLFGIQLHENFDRPYLSTTPSVFWTRWHMSLSFWIRDFLFLPLATVRRSVWWRNFSLVIAMFGFGIWHIGAGHAGFLMMIWGVYQGTLLVLHRQWQEFRKRIGFEWSGAVATGISWLLTFSAICIGYIFFRANGFHQAFAMLKAMASLGSYRHLTFDHSFYVMTFLAAAGYFVVIGAGELLDRLNEVGLRESSRGPLRAFFANAIGTLARERWVWITPAVVVLALYLSVMFHPGQAETGPVMYALF